MERFRYDVINPRNNRQEPFTGVFDDKSKCQQWERKFLKFWHERGAKLVKVKCNGKLKNNI